MKLEDLLETPIIHDKELTFDSPMRPFISLDSIKRDFEFIHKGKATDGTDYWVIMKKNHEIAIIGVPGLRDPDKKEGMDIYGDVEFKRTTQIKGMQSFDTNRNVIQVSLVRVASKFQSRGYGFYLYLALAHAGYVVISDNQQYIGGKELWKKIAKLTVDSKYKVYVIDTGKVRLDNEGKPIVFDGDNIGDSELWSTNNEKKYTLFALRSDIVNK